MTYSVLFNGIPTNIPAFMAEVFDIASPSINPITIFSSTLSPEGALQANPGSVCLVAGAVPSSVDGMWLKSAGVSSTGWTQQGVAALTTPGPVIVDADTNANALRTSGTVLFEPTAARTIDLPGTGPTAWDLTKSATLRVCKDTRTLFGLTLNVTTNGGGLWTTPAGLNQDYVLPGSYEPLCGMWDVMIDGPNKTVRVIDFVRGAPVVMSPAPTASPGDTLDLFAGGTFSGHTLGSGTGIMTYQTGAPTSDGSAFITTAVDNVRRLQDLGAGQRLLLEGSRAQALARSQDMFSNVGVITAPWVAVGGATGVGLVAGSPMGDATVTNLTLPAVATAGITQAFTATATHSGAYSVWARVTAATQKCRLQALLKDGSLVTSADFTLTTTWQRIELLLGTIGAVGSTSNPEFRIINGSDAAARTIQVWGAQAEIGVSYTTPTSYIKTTGGVGATRTADTLYYPASAIPASFLTRGVVVSWQPDYASEEAWSGGSLSLLNWENPAQGISVSGNLDTLQLTGSKANTPYAAGSARLQLNSITGYNITSTWTAQPRILSEPFTFARRTVLSITAELYRGAVTVNGVTTVLGGGPLTWPAGTLTLCASAGGAISNSFGGSLGRYLTAA